MALLSGLEILLILLIVGALFLLSVRGRKRRGSVSALPYLIVGLLLLAVLFLGKAVFALFWGNLLLTLLVLILLAVIVFSWTRR